MKLCKLEEVEMENPKKILSALIEDKFYVENYKELIPCLIILGAYQIGSDGKARNKIYDWVKEVVSLGKIKTEYFNKCWNNLEKNEVFRDGKVFIESPELTHIELALLITVARGFVSRSDA